ncbi:MAG: hypothetical protein ACFFAH_00055 [Promethearchaeota archaeon]
MSIYYDNRLYLFIPICCIIFWFIFCLLTYSLDKNDYETFYFVGIAIREDPNTIYSLKHCGVYVYTPFFAFISSFTFSLIPFLLGFFILVLINLFLAIISIIQFDNILKLLEVKEKAFRLLFLIVISNGYIVFGQFSLAQTKYIVLTILLFIIKREIKYRKGHLTKTFKYYFINYFLLMVILGLAPYLIFLVAIYLFNDINFKDLIKKEQIKKYIMICSIFIIQNFHFVLFPQLIFGFLQGFNRPTDDRRKLKIMLYVNLIQVSTYEMFFITILFTLILLAISLILIINKNLTIERKFGYFCLGYLFFGVFSYVAILALVLLSIILFLYPEFLKNQKFGTENLKINSLLLIGLISIMGISFFANWFIIMVIPSLYDADRLFFGIMEIIFHSGLLISLYFLYKFKRKSEDKKEVKITSIRRISEFNNNKSSG